MPIWFYPLMLVIILAGYVFLFLQGQLLRRGIAALEEGLRAQREQSERLAKAQADLLDRMQSHPRPSEALEQLPAEIAAAAEDQNRGHLALMERLDQLAETLAQHAELLTPKVIEPVTETAPARVQFPESVALEFLGREGFANVRVLGERHEAAGTRLLVSAHYGDQLRQGHVTVNEGRVVDASLKIPTSFFP
jgi:hypothetical protein